MAPQLSTLASASPSSGSSTGSDKAPLVTASVAPEQGSTRPADTIPLAASSCPPPIGPASEMPARPGSGALTKLKSVLVQPDRAPSPPTGCWAQGETSELLVCQLGKNQSASTSGERTPPSCSPPLATSPSRWGELQRRRPRVALTPLRGTLLAAAFGVSVVTTASRSAEIQCTVSGAGGSGTSPALVLLVAHASSLPASDPD